MELIAGKGSGPRVIVLGLGGMGSATVWQLARAGARVVGLEQFGPAHARGSSHGKTRVIRQAYFEHPSYVPLLLRAYELWHEAERESGNQLLTLCGGLMMGAPGSEVVSGSIRSAREHGLAHEVLDSSEIRRRYPLFQIPDHHIALFEAKAGVVHTERSVQTHLDLATAYGADLRFNEPALSWTAEPDGSVSVLTGRGIHRADHLVITPGPWAPTLLTDLGLPLEVQRQVLFWFQPPGGVLPMLPGRFPIYIWEGEDGLQPYGFPAMDGAAGGAKVAFFRIPNAQTCTPETIDRSARQEDEAAMRGMLRRFLPALDGPLLQTATCLYTNTPDLHFAMGPHPRHPQVSFAAGFSGHGFKFCSVVGEILADLAIRGATRHNLGLFDCRRFASG